MILSLAAPGKYLQGKHLLRGLYTHAAHLGSKFALLTDKTVYEIIREKVEESFAASEGRYGVILYNGESTREEADRVAEIIKRERYDVIIGAGGGKALDTAKLTADILSLPLVIVPTAASSDAPCSAMSVIYDTNGTFVVSARMKRNPDIVLVDTAVIANAPVRTLVAGMGDAFATYYEARACAQSGACNFSGGTASESGYALAKLCNELLLEYGYKAKQDAEMKQWSTALEKVVEANIYLSGIGFENNGCAIAHAMYSGMTAILKPFPALHGEAVAFGTIVQLVTERMFKTDQAEFNQAVEFYKKVGLPLTFEDMGIRQPSNDQLYLISEAACTKSRNAFNMPFKITPEIIYDSIITTLRLFGRDKTGSMSIGSEDACHEFV
ncbi:MAG TPA: glycerol dehydrogenase [Anaerovoracaceae bacterium]|nr:glycerol dehydrogenase [Anaerovoracaceae bacterium]